MPEASVGPREALSWPASLSLVVNPAAARVQELITMAAIEQVMPSGHGSVRAAVISQLVGVRA